MQLPPLAAWTLLFLAIACVSGARSAAAQSNTLYLTDAPTWMHYFCDSSETDPDGSVSLQGMHCYQNFTLPQSATLTVTSKLASSGSAQNVPVGAVFVFATGTCTIAGTINASALRTSVGNAGGAGGGGGGGSGSYSGATGADSDVFGSAALTRMAAGANGGAPGQNGSSAVAPQLASEQFAIEKFNTLGSPSGAAGGAGGGNPGAAGGNGGGGALFICATINFTGQINANGATGATGGGGIGGGGGGGGGVVLMAAQNYIAATGAISVSGGNGGLGGAGAGNGGNGANGWFSQLTF